MNPAFLPKTSTEVALSSYIELSSFYPEPSTPLEEKLHLMCPVRALWICLHRTTHSRGQNRALFIHWDKGRAQCPVSKRWICAFLMLAIRIAYRNFGREHEILRANPHSIGCVAASWAEIARVSVSKICLGHALLPSIIISDSFSEPLHIPFQGKAGIENTVSSPALLPSWPSTVLALGIQVPHQATLGVSFWGF